MSHTPVDAFRIVSIDPISRGVGFVVLESPDHLVDWGVRSAPIHSTERVLAVVTDLLAHYRPDLLCVENCSVATSRRGPLARRLIDRIHYLAHAKNVPIASVTMENVRKVFAGRGAFTKAQIAASIANRFPVLVPHLPPLRKTWMSEDIRMSIFDAVAFAVTHLELREVNQS